MIFYEFLIRQCLTIEHTSGHLTNNHLTHQGILDNPIVRLKLILVTIWTFLHLPGTLETIEITLAVRADMWLEYKLRAETALEHGWLR